jgi:glucans biosynthesis protein C
MYIAHLPLVMAVQAMFVSVDMHWALKYPLILVLTLAPLIVSYDLLVRSTWLGALLNGRRYPRGLGGASSQVSAPG